MCSVSCVDKDGVDRLVSRRLHELRRERGITLAALAEQTGISAAHLSRLEKGDRQPSIGALLELARVYNISLSNLVDEHAHPSHHLVRAADAAVHHGRDGRYTVLTGARAGLAVVRLELRGGQRSNSTQHTGEEWLHVLTGKVVLTLDGEQLSLDVDDSIHFDSALPHQLTSVGRHRATVLIASTSATMPMQHPIPLRTTSAHQK